MPLPGSCVLDLCRNGVPVLCGEPLVSELFDLGLQVGLYGEELVEQFAFLAETQTGQDRCFA